MPLTYGVFSSLCFVVLEVTRRDLTYNLTIQRDRENPYVNLT